MFHLTSLVWLKDQIIFIGDIGHRKHHNFVTSQFHKQSSEIISNSFWAAL